MTRLTLALLTAALVVASPATAPTQGRPLAPRSYKPTRNWCPTNRTCFSAIHWSTYASTRAVGSGRAKECAGGGGFCRVHRSVKATLDQPRFVCGAHRFTRLRLFGRLFALDSQCHAYLG
jgi:hypothetical protein